MKSKYYDGPRCWACWQPIELVNRIWYDYDVREKYCTHVVHRCRQEHSFARRVARAEWLWEWFEEKPWEQFEPRSLTWDEIAWEFGNPCQWNP